MHPMAIDRRQLLTSAAAGLLAGIAPARVQAAPPPGLYAAARQGADGAYSAAIFTADGRDVRSIALPERGHDITVCPISRRCVVFARRPGNFAIAFSRDSSRPPVAFTTIPERHMYGHGVFSHDGRLLYTTENEFEAARGVIGIYDVEAGFKRIGEHDSHGIGPHDLALLHGRTVAVVANGGLREHPDIGGGRRVLNLGAIETSIAYVHLETGDLLERHVLGKPGMLSLRHLDVGRNDGVVIGAQIEGPPDVQTALVYRHRPQEPLAAMSLPADVGGRLAGYVSSVAVDAAGEVAIISSSRGNVAMMVDIARGTVLRTVACEDVSGVAPGPAARSFLVTSGHGLVAAASPEAGLAEGVSAPWAWDNHAVAVRH
jgi:hypothetical protein